VTRICSSSSYKSTLFSPIALSSHSTIMRVSWLVLPAVIVAVNAAHPTLIPRHRGDHPSPPLARQAHAPRALFDVCVSANLDLLANASQLLGLGSVLGPILFDGKVDLCLCLKVRICTETLAHADPP